MTAILPRVEKSRTAAPSRRAKYCACQSLESIPLQYRDLACELRLWYEGRMSRLALCLLLSVYSFAAGPSADLTRTLDRIFNKKEFAAKTFGPARWIADGAAYTTVEGSDIVRYDTASGSR